ncbi:MAG: helix-turn-helix transcriptional regulator [Desulfofustis sp. PB-SRB1]|nr:helix-turn-helix transcriptional regulator [Desulfofustis sp. PB-SRB1]MBM1002324.1 helix-turn-helix transcriptional regulator [Desulfofustis sp. PB-SRB1]HBH29027.1 helix-turn-helix transcriptional regulator [Desulfofustis sp.]HBH31405.1 helix-turn-helix transcriptional regulator [Desulfofustis sp.]
MSEASSNIYQLALDSISAHIAILDEDGDIIETNRAWREYGLNNGIEVEPSCVGLNYLHSCDQAAAQDVVEARVIGDGIRQVIAGEIREFFINYPCHSPTEQCWFALRVVRFREPGANKVILSHENITPLMKAHQELAAQERHLRDQAEKLQESNIALKVLLDHRQKDRQQLEENMLANVRTLVLPYVQELMDARLGKRERTIVEIVEERLSDIAAPFLNRLTSLTTVLTPQELKVAVMVREGRSSAEIADVLMVSVSGVNFHRKQIRKKLGLTGTSGNLRSYLLSLV